MCTVLLPPGGNPIAVNKYIKIISNMEDRVECKYERQLSYALENLRTTEENTCMLSTDMKHVGNAINCIIRALEFRFILFYFIIIIIIYFFCIETTCFVTSILHGGRPFSINTCIISSSSVLLNNLFYNARSQ
jgi:hypothetical protein